MTLQNTNHDTEFPDLENLEIDDYHCPDQILGTLDRIPFDSDWPKEYRQVEELLYKAAACGQEYINILNQDPDNFIINEYEQEERALRELEMAGRALETASATLNNIDTGYGDTEIVPYGDLDDE